MKRLVIYILAILPLSLAAGCRNTTPEEVQGEQAHEAADEVVLTSEQFRNAGVLLQPVQEKDLGQSVRVSGRLEVPAQNKAAVTSLLPGIIREIRVHPGEQVRKGQIIARIVNTDVAGMQERLVTARSGLQLARQEYSRQQELVSGNAAPLKNLQRAEADLSSRQAQVDALENELQALGIADFDIAAGRIAAELQLRAPIGGTITEIYTRIGDKVDPATPVADIVDNSELHLDLFVYEKDLPGIHIGQLIHFVLTYNAGTEYDAEIFSIGKAFKDDSRSVPVHAEVKGDKTGLIEGMSVTAIVSSGSRPVKAVPAEAVVSDAGKDYVFILTASGHDHDHPEGHDHDHAHDEEDTYRFRKIPVVRGIKDLGYLEIQPLEPIPDDARIATKGAFFLMGKMNQGDGHDHAH